MTDPENLDAVTSMYLIGKRWLLDEEIEHSADEEVPTTASQVISSSNMTSMPEILEQHFPFFIPPFIFFLSSHDLDYIYSTLLYVTKTHIEHKNII